MTNTAPTPPWLSVIGLGEDGLAGLSPSAASALEAAEFVVGGERHLALAAAALRGTVLPWRSPIEATFPEILERRGRPTCILASGDPFFFGIGSVLARLVSPDEIRCWPAPSAFTLAAARLGWAIQDCACVSVHGRALGRVVPYLQPGARLLVLSWDGSTPALLADLLRRRGFGPSRLHVLEAMGGPAELVRRATAAHFDLDGIADLNTVAIEVFATPEARIRGFAPGLPDDWFEHDGQITKAPIRALTLSALAPRPRDVLWDVGAGSGAVSVEWLLASPTATAVAIERLAERSARVARNAEHWGVADRLTLRAGATPDALDGLPTPDAVFLGGGVAEPGLLDRCIAALAPGGRVVVNAVTLESQALVGEAYRRRGGDLFSFATAQAEPLGAFHAFRPAMPILQWRYIRPLAEPMP